MMPFSSINVLDFTGSIAGNFCCRLFSDHGANVIKVQTEKRVDLVKEYGPHISFLPGPIKSGMYHFLNYNKSSISYSGAKTFLRQSELEFDLVVLDNPENSKAEIYNKDLVGELLPGVAVCNISHFGASDGLTGRPVSDLTMQALTGMCSANGLEGKAPLKEPGTETEFITGANAFVGSMASLISRDLNGVKQSINVSHIGSLLSAFSPYILGAQYVGKSRGQQTQGLHFGLIPCKDGYVSISVRHEPTWQHMWLFFGDPDFAYDERFNTAEKRRRNEDELSEILLPIFLQYTRDELFHGLSPLKILVGMAESIEDLLSDPHLLERQSFLRYGKDQFVTIPGANFKMSETPWSFRSDAPAQSDFVETNIEDHLKNITKRSAFNVSRPDYPLSKTRAVVLTQAWAGAYCTQILADLGMEVIQVESIGRLDPWRGGVPPRISGMYPENIPGSMPWNRCAMFHAVNRNKKGITLDLNNDDGKLALRELISLSDVFIENFSGRVIGNLGLKYQEIRKINPSIVMVRMPTYGTFGPYSNYPGNGGTTEPASGMAYMMGYENGDPMNSGVMHTDAYSGVLSAGAALLGLKHRIGTGTGQEIDISQQETTMALLGEYFLRYSLDGISPGRQENTNINYAPQGCYETSDRKWLALSVKSDLEWDKFCDVIGRVDLKNDKRFNTHSNRATNRKKLDSNLQEMIKVLESSFLSERLRRHGIACELVHNFSEVLNSAVYKDKEKFFILDQDDVGTYSYPSPPWDFSGSSIRMQLPAPTLGQHNKEILSDLIGLSDSLVYEMKKSECIGDFPLV